MSLKLGVPSKGRLMEKTFKWFEKRGVTLSRSASDRRRLACSSLRNSCLTQSYFT